MAVGREPMGKGKHEGEPHTYVDFEVPDDAKSKETGDGDGSRDKPSDTK
ncbi:hypothetical protein [Nonomuraea sp. NPDC002799]